MCHIMGGPQEHTIYDVINVHILSRTWHSGRRSRACHDPVLIAYAIVAWHVGAMVPAQEVATFSAPKTLWDDPI